MKTNYYFGAIKTKIELDGKDVDFICSPECVQDMHNYNNYIFVIRTPEITDKEINDWQVMLNFLNNLNFEEIKRKYNLKIVDRED